MNNVVTRVVYEASFKHTFNYSIFQILYYSMNIYMTQEMKKKLPFQLLLPRSGI